MSSPNPHQTAKDIREQAAEWLFQAHSVDFTDKERSKLDLWLNESELHRASYWRLEAAWAEAARLAALAPLPRKPVSFRRPFEARLFKSAIAIAVAVAAGLSAYQYYSTPSGRTYATAVGGHRTLTLPDGTVIGLNTDTVIQISDNLAIRQVRLEKGEAFFEVKHDADKPFTVLAGDHRITDLGTKFIVQQSKERLKVSLLEGRAQLETLNGPDAQSTELTPGEVAVATAGKLSVTRVSIPAMTNELGWRKGVLVFDDTTLADAVTEFNRYNVEKIVIDDPSILRMRVNGTFPVHARHDFAEVARAVFGLRAEDRGDQIVISR